MGKRLFLFLLTNMAVLAVVRVLMMAFGLDAIPYSNGYGGMHYMPWQSVLAGAALMGFVGSIFSLAISKWMAKRSTGAEVITAPRNEEEAWLLAIVRNQANTKGLGMPEVAIFPSESPNAFATGMFRNSALVAVSSGLLRTMTRKQVEAVVGHEMSHIANGDMVTLTLLQGVLNTFVIFLSRVGGALVDSLLAGRGDDHEERRGPGIGSFVVTMVLQLAFGFLASMIVAWFSRQREFRADAGGAALTSTDAMADALARLSGPKAALPGGLTAFGITEGGIATWFASHPPIEVRIAALRDKRYDADS